MFQVPVDFEKLVVQRAALDYEMRFCHGHAYVLQVHEHEKYQNHCTRIASVQYKQPQYVYGQYNGQIQDGEKQMEQRVITVFGFGRWRVHLVGFDVFLVDRHHCTVLAQQRGKGQEAGHGYHSGVHTLH